MSSAGTILDMIKRMKANRALQMHNRNKQTKRKLGMIDYSKMKNVYNTDKFKPKSDVEKEELRKELMLIQRRDKLLLLVCMIFVFLIFILGYLCLT